MTSPNLRTELPLLALLAILWGSSYLFIKIAVAEIPPITLIALRVLGAAIFLMIVMGLRSEKLPRDAKTWRMLLVQAFFNSIGSLLPFAAQAYKSASTNHHGWRLCGRSRQTETLTERPL